jgi:hypothetical protein
LDLALQIFLNNLLKHLLSQKYRQHIFIVLKFSTFTVRELSVVDPNPVGSDNIDIKICLTFEKFYFLVVQFVFVYTHITISCNPK